MEIWRIEFSKRPLKPLEAYSSGNSKNLMSEYCNEDSPRQKCILKIFVSRIHFLARKKKSKK